MVERLPTDVHGRIHVRVKVNVCEPSLATCLRQSCSYRYRAGVVAAEDKRNSPRIDDINDAFLRAIESLASISGNDLHVTAIHKIQCIE